MSRKKRYIELPQRRAMVMLPEKAAAADITVTIIENGIARKVSISLGPREVVKAMEDADRNYIDDDDVFELTSLGWEEWERNKEVKERHENRRSDKQAGSNRRNHKRAARGALS